MNIPILIAVISVATNPAMQDVDLFSAAAAEIFVMSQLANGVAD